MTQALFAQCNKAFENHAPGKLYLFPYPAINPGGAAPTQASIVEGFLALLFGTDTTYTLPVGNPWGDIDENGLDFKVTPDSLDFPHNDGSVPNKIQSGIKEAGLDFTIYDADAQHWADLFGVAPADLVTIAGTTPRKAALLALPNSTLKWVAIFVTPSSVFGQNDIYLWPRVNFLTQPSVKYSQKDKIVLKCTLACGGDLFLNSAQGVPVFFIPITVTGPVE